MPPLTNAITANINPMKYMAFRVECFQIWGMTISRPSSAPIPQLRSKIAALNPSAKPSHGSESLSGSSDAIVFRTPGWAERALEITQPPVRHTRQAPAITGAESGALSGNVS